MSRRNLFIAHGPLLVFNLTEARDRFHGGENNVLLCLYSRQSDRPLMDSVIDNGWTQVVYFRLTALTREIYPLLLNGLVKRLDLADVCYLGWPRHVSLHLRNAVRPKRTVMVDEGNSVLALVEGLKQRTPRRSRWWERLEGKQLADDFLQQAGFFSTYDLAPYLSAERYTHNDYRSVKARLNACPGNGDIYFIGSALVEGGLMSHAQMHHLMCKVVAHYGDRPVHYVTHRHEDYATLTRLGRSIGFDVVRFNTILENVFLGGTPLPDEVSGFCSSALTSLHAIYGLPVAVFPVAMETLPNDAERRSFKAIYNEYRRLGFRFIED